ncbi:MFS transporter [Trichophyton mentagrophytes]|nr:MFS transporter [Trichophyton mentagrophytes]
MELKPGVLQHRPEGELVVDEDAIKFLEDCEHREKQLIRRIDWRLLPIIGAMYAISLIDRTNISSARIAGLDKELKLYIDSRYSVVLLVFFIPYFIFELPSNLLLRKVGSATWLAGISLAWGSIMLGSGFVHDYPALVVCRFFLGFFEAGLFPGCVYLVSCWYVRYEVQTRLAIFYLISVLASGFSSILSFGLIQMEGLAGFHGWRWIFIVEGALTQAIAIAAYFIIIDFPDKAAKTGFLSSNEAKYISHRLEKDRADSVPDPLTLVKLKRHLADWKLWTFSTMFLATTVPAYALTYFAPIIIRAMGYSPAITSLLTAPPTVFACVVAMALSWVADKYRMRAPIIAVQAIICIMGLMITAYHPNNNVRYFGFFLGAAGCQGNIPAILAYQSNNIRFQSKRAVGSALQIGFGALGGIIASTVFREQDAPKYIPGLWVTTAFQLFILVAVACTTLIFRKRNNEVDEGRAKTPIEGLEGFKYTL